MPFIMAMNMTSEAAVDMAVLMHSVTPSGWGKELGDLRACEQLETCPEAMVQLLCMTTANGFMMQPLDPDHPRLRSAFQSSDKLDGIDCAKLTTFVDAENFCHMIACSTGPCNVEMRAFEVLSFGGSNNVYPHSGMLAALAGQVDMAHQWTQHDFQNHRDTYAGLLAGSVSHAVADFLLGAGCPWFLCEGAEAREVTDAADEAAPDTAFGLYTNDTDHWVSHSKQSMNVAATFPGTIVHMFIRQTKHGRILIGKTENPNPHIAPPHEAEWAEGIEGMPPASTADQLEHECCAQLCNAIPRWISAAEILVKYKRYDEALAHVDYCQEHDMHMIRLPWCPWLKGRILSAMGKSELEVVAEFEKAIVAATKMEAPLFTALVLHDMIALCPAESARGDVSSRYEEACFELTMDEPSPMRAHLESDLPFAS